MKSFRLLRIGLVTAAMLTASSGCGSGDIQATPLAAQSTTTLAVPQHEDFMGRLSVYPTKARLLFQADVNNGTPYIQIIRVRDLGKNRYPVATIVDGLCLPQGLSPLRAALSFGQGLERSALAIVGFGPVERLGLAEELQQGLVVALDRLQEECDVLLSPNSFG